MATVREVIARAYRKANLISRGSEPDAGDASDALQVLQSLYDEMVSSGVFGRLEDVVVETDYTAGENERIFNTSASAVAITLPETIEDEFTGEARPPRDGALVVIAEDTPEAYLYSSRRGRWVTLNGLALGDAAPLSEKSLDGLAALLAQELCDEQSVAVPAGVAVKARAFRALIAHRLDAPRRTTQAEFY